MDRRGLVLSLTSLVVVVEEWMEGVACWIAFAAGSGQTCPSLLVMVNWV